jgi:RNA polymerase sigma-32 factor
MSGPKSTQNRGAMGTGHDRIPAVSGRIPGIKQATMVKKTKKKATAPSKTAGKKKRAAQKKKAPARTAAKKVVSAKKRAPAKAVRTAAKKKKPVRALKQKASATSDKAAAALKPAPGIEAGNSPVPEKQAGAKKPVKKRVAAGGSVDKALVKFDPLQRYLSEISAYSLLTRERERELAMRVREEGDTEAALEMVTSNLRLVVKIALEFQRVWMQNLLDLIQEGNIGLMQAVKKFDPYKNVKFSYYASFWIKAYILKFIMDNWRLVKIGTTQGQRKLFFKLKKEKQKLIDEGFDPKPKLLSDRLGVSEREIIDMDQRLDGWDVSLDAPLKNDSDTERIEFLSMDSASAEDRVAKKEMENLLHEKIAEFRKQMTDRELDIFDNRIFSDEPVTLQEIGDRYGISRERVRQVEKNVVKKMREFIRREIPDFEVYTEGITTE